MESTNHRRLKSTVVPVRTLMTAWVALGQANTHILF
ncbi:hypothetical protein SAMN05421510_100477 [Nitrosomonas ureae]|uniref:Uncharacterized protein n=1 Tax=Nitrosomonas ureae TaxID=44577 RepID=A0A1H9AR78_9PROT|nr:hypothetical protein SAMN05216406_101239 [Nitrosomonas ureae]SEP78428.1 hypothetical protein SAMN05421510_100477 [Nitrosomonas ureae]